MAKLPKRATDRITSGLKRFQPVLSSARSRDVNESDTALIVTDMRQDIFGYDKYSEITSEYRIRSTYCDLAVKLDGQVTLLIEVKAIGTDLKDQHVKQAIDYAANQGVDWVALTNGITWQVYRIIFGKPIESEMVVKFDLLDRNSRTSTHIETLGLLAKEGWKQAHLSKYHSQRQALSRFALSALLLDEPVLNVIRRELRRLSPNVRVTIDEIKTVLREEVVKRDVLEGENAVSARRKVSRASRRAASRKTASTDTENEEAAGRLLPVGDKRLPVPGTLLTRTYKGRDLAVQVLDDDFAFEGRRYKSLSAIAKEVTGNQRNGFVFFGLNEEKKAE